MNKLFKMLQESFGNDLQRNGFDLSRRDIFSSKVGIKVPAFVMETVPDDYHEIRPVNMIRTMPFNEANFVRMKQHMDFYYVPFTAFMTNFHEYVQQTTDPVNSLLVGQNVERTFPVYPLDGLLLAIGLAHFCSYDQAGYNNLAELVDVVEDDVDGIVHRVYTEVSDLAGIFIAFNPEDSGAMPVVDMFGNPLYRDSVRLLDMLGYGNYLNLINKDLVGDSSAGIPGQLDEFLLYFKNILLSSHGKKINIFRFAAYQCVYQNFGINTVYDKLNVYSFNFDDIVRNGAAHDDVIGAWRSRFDNTDSYDKWWRVNCIFSVRYSQWKKDIFTSAYPDSQFGGVSVVSVNYSVGDSIGNIPANERRVLGVRNGSDLIAMHASGGISAEAAYSSFSILDLRRAEALQGWKEDMMRSGFRAKQRQRSQFGVSPSYDPHCMPYVLGSVTADVKKDVVTGTSGDNFADLASTGMSTLGNDVIKFDGSGRKDYGIIIGLLSIVPEADYDSFGIDMHNMKIEPFDFYTPAFQNIGLQPMVRDYLDAQFTETEQYNYGLLPKILGYVPRYAEYKQAFDKVHGEFCLFRDDVYHGVGFDPDFTSGVFRSYVSTRFDMEKYGLSRLASLYVNPAIVDDIFKVNVDGDNRQVSDQFMVNCYFDVKSVRPMSVLGLPRWV